MLEIAGGVILGGIVLLVLYEFREIVAKTVVWGGMAILAIWLVGAVILGGCQMVGRFKDHAKTAHTIPEGLFSWFLIFAFFFLISEIGNKFSNTRDLIGIFFGKSSTGNTSHHPFSPETRVWVKEPVIWIDIGTDSTKWDRLFNMALNSPGVFGVKLKRGEDSKAVMGVLYAIDRCRDISYATSENCIYAWKRRNGEPAVTL
jgi:hypothetical protein